MTHGPNAKIAPIAELLMAILWMGICFTVVAWAQAPALYNWLGWSTDALASAARQASVAPHQWPRLWEAQFATQSNPLETFGINFLLFPVLIGWTICVIGWGLLAIRFIRALIPSPFGFRLPGSLLVLGTVSSGLALFLVGSIRATPVTLTLTMALGLCGYLVQGICFNPAIWRLFGSSKNPVWFIAALTVTILCLFLITTAGLVPPIQSDAMRYHLAAPQEWLRQGRIAPLPGNAFSAFPFLPGMHYLLFEALGAPELAAIFHGIIWYTLSLVAITLVRDSLPRHHRAAPLSAAALLIVTLPCSLVLATWPFIDHFVTLFVLLSGWSLHRILRQGLNRSPHPGEGILLGIWLGALLSTKYTALPILLALTVALVAAVALSRPDQRPPLIQAVLRLLPWTAAALAIVGSPWYLRNLWHYGNPIYPILAQHIGRGEWTPEAARLYSSKLAEKGDFLTTPIPLGILTPLWNSTFEWLRFEAHYLGGQAPLIFLCALTGVGVFTFQRIRHIRPQPAHRLILPLWAAMIYLTWALTYQSNRMLLPVLMLLLPTATAIIAPSLVAAARWRRILGAIAILAVTAQSGLWAFQWLILTQPQPPLPYILSHQSREAYLQSALNYYRPYQYLANLQRESATPIHVLHHGEHRIYYARHTAFWSDWFDTPAILRIIRQDQCRTVADLRQALQRRAITHIFVNDAELAPQLERYFRRRFTQGEWVLTESFLATLKPLQDQPGQFRILEVPVP